MSNSNIKWGKGAPAELPDAQGFSKEALTALAALVTPPGAA